jgi:CubicO group peptidase (beta-lactamase class C family)
MSADPTVIDTNILRAPDEMRLREVPHPAVVPPVVFAARLTKGPTGFVFGALPSWETFWAQVQGNAAKGLRLESVDAWEYDGQPWYMGTWLPGSDGWLVYSDANLEALVAGWAQRAGQARLVSVAIRPMFGGLPVLSAWLGAPTGQKLVTDLSIPDFLQTWGELSGSGWRLTLARLYPGVDEALVLGVFEPGDDGHGLLISTNFDDILRQVTSPSAPSLIDFSVFDDANAARWYTAAFRERQFRETLVYGLDWGTLNQTLQSHLAAGESAVAVIGYPGSTATPTPDWAGSYAASLTDKMGYAWAAIQAGGSLQSGASGLARSPVDSPPNGVPFTTATRLNLASVSKSVTAVAVLRAIYVDKLIASVDAPFYPYIEQRVPTVAPGVDHVTIRQLLTMQSGLALDQTLNFPNGIWAFLTSFLAQPMTNQAGYSNTNFTILQAVLDQVAGDYATYVKSKVLAPLGVDVNLFNERPDPQASAALSYSAAGDRQPGRYFGGFDAVAAGGWIAPVGEVAKFAAGLRTGAVISLGVASQMFGESLGWYTYDGYFGQYFHHNGGLAWGNQGLNTGLIHFTDGWDGVLVMNSPQGAQSIIENDMIPAFQAG